MFERCAEGSALGASVLRVSLAADVNGFGLAVASMVRLRRTVAAAGNCDVLTTTFAAGLV
jgi:hypothetical protein